MNGGTWGGCGLLLVLCLALPVQATTRFVGKTNASNSGGCTNQSTPCATITYCVQQMSGGDTCLIDDGTYFEHPGINPPSGSSGAPTMVKAKNKRQVILWPDDCDSGGWTPTQGRHDITWDGIVIEGIKNTQGSCNDFADTVPGWTPAEKARKLNYGVSVEEMGHEGSPNTNSNLSFINGEIRNTRQSTLLIAGTNWLIDGNFLHDNGNHDQPCGYFSDCFAGPHHHGVYASIDNSTISHNTFRNIACYNYQIFASGSATVVNDIADGNDQSGSGCGVTLGGSGNHIYRNNLSVDDGTYSGVFPNALLVQSSNNQIYNNTIINGRIEGDYGNGGNVYRNNLLCGSNTPQIHCGGTSCTKDHNQEGSCGSIFTSDYHLLSSATLAINTGANASGIVPTDKDKNARPIGGAWDLGAYEFGAAITPVADHLAFGQPPTNATAGAAISPAITVQVKDQSNNNFAQVRSITLTLGANPGGSTLSGTATQSANAAGLATFAGMSLNNPGAGYTLTATSAGLPIPSVISSPFTIVAASSGTLRYVATTGSDSGPCTNQSTPCQTVGYCLQQMAPGDTCQLADGWYVGEYNLNPPSGISASQPTIIKAEHPRQAILQSRRPDDQEFDLGKGRAYITFDGLVLDGASSIGGTDRLTGYSIFTEPESDVLPATHHHINLINIEVRNHRKSGVLMDGDQFLADHVWCHHNGGPEANGVTPRDHCFYFGVSNSIIRNSVFGPQTRTDGMNVTCYNMQLYSSHNHDTRNNLIENNEFTDSSCGVTYQSGGNLFRNNVWHHERGVGLNALGPNARVINNTFVSNGGSGINMDANTDGVYISNNIACFNGNPQIYINSNPGNVDAGDNMTSCPAGTFVDAASNDYHLAGPGSPAYNTGGNRLSDVPTDKDGCLRPAGGAFDKGAYEFGATGCATSSPVATSIVFGQPPTPTAPGGIISPAVTVQVLDQSNHAFAVAGTSITMALGTNPGGPSTVLSGTSPQLTNAAGLATFPNLSINNAGTGYTLVAASSGLGTVTSGPFSVTTAPTGNARLAWWKFDEGSGATAVDSSGQGHTGTLGGPVAPAWVTGNVGTFALQFSGTNWMDMVGSFTDQTYSWAMWVKGTAAPDTSDQLALANGIQSDNTWGFGWSSSTPRFQQAAFHQDGTGVYFTAKIPDTLLANTWYHVGATYGGGQLIVYLNGVPKATTTGITSVLTPSGNFRLGNDKSGHFGLQGALDDVQIFNYALTQPEMAALAGTAPPVAGKPRVRHQVVLQ